MSQRCLIWFNRDLRIKDNAVLSWLDETEGQAVGLVIEPEYQSAHQREFFQQSVVDLKKNLKQANVDLFFIAGSPEIEIVRWVQKYAIQTVLVTKVFNTRDQEAIQKVELALSTNTTAELKSFDQGTLLHQEDLPFALDKLPPTFTPFRKLVEASWTVRAEEKSEPRLKGFEAIAPSATQFVEIKGGECPLPYDFHGGETSAWLRLKEYIWDTRSIDVYKETRNGMLNKNDSSKFSPWLANGSLSARSIYHEIKKYEQIHGANDSTYWLIFELLWRDYFKFLSLKIGKQLFSLNGSLKRQVEWKEDNEIYASWCSGTTGLDFIDANMKEIVHSGWMSNRGRQNVASHFAKQLRLKWTLGARFFEDHLIDNDVESNWGNWQYLAGVGTDPRDRDFNVQRQADYYDADFKYRNKWLEKTHRG